MVPWKVGIHFNESITLTIDIVPDLIYVFHLWSGCVLLLLAHISSGENKFSSKTKKKKIIILFFWTKFLFNWPSFSKKKKRQVRLTEFRLCVSSARARGLLYPAMMIIGRRHRCPRYNNIVRTLFWFFFFYGRWQRRIIKREHTVIIVHNLYHYTARIVQYIIKHTRLTGIYIHDWLIVDIL